MGEGSPDWNFAIFRHIIFCPCARSVGWETHFLAAEILLAELAKGKATYPRTTRMWKSFVTLSSLVEGVKGAVGSGRDLKLNKHLSTDLKMWWLCIFATLNPGCDPSPTPTRGRPTAFPQYSIRLLSPGLGKGSSLLRVNNLRSPGGRGGAELPEPSRRSRGIWVPQESPRSRSECSLSCPSQARRSGLLPRSPRWRWRRRWPWLIRAREWPRRFAPDGRRGAGEKG